MSKIAPHEGNELDMLADGSKVFAVLEEGKHDDLLSHVIFGNGILNIVTEWYNADELMLFHYTLGRVNKEMYCMLRDNREYYILMFGKEDYQRKMGKVFGYSDEDIEAFISNPPDCNCEKCGG